ncbi:MAG: hypothetical protein A2Z37_03400 [Chloroflexi bacterium RBG_19FT_COMBO_62_14]|nr:MAG: hypothetical protein A2Z37_03400 [Chloroflexi bacterium RBG_19FT_COMBO_62_14]
MTDILEDFWSEVLSNDPDRVLAALAGVSAAERDNVIRHLQRMAGEPGWREAQRARAQAALDALRASSTRG